MERAIRINALGPLQLIRSDETIRLPGRKQRLLLAALLVHAPRTVSTSRLVDALWDDELPEDPAAGLQVHVSRLRRSLGAGGGAAIVVTEPHGYRLDVDAFDSDTARFEGLVNEARRSSDPEPALDDLERALALWRGPALAEFRELPFARGEAARLEELRTAAIELQAELLMAVGRFDRAVAVLEPVIAADPLRERPRDQSARALYHLGRQADALAVCRQFRRAVGEELGLDPSPAMDRLERLILDHGLESAGPPPAAAAPTAHPPEQPVGPPLEIGYLDAAGRRIAVGRAGAGPVLVVLPGFVSNLTTIAAGRDPRSRLLARLADSFHVVTYDRFGTGLSPGGVDDYSAPASAAELEGLLDSLGEPEVTILAISCAGPVAATVAARRPEAVARLVFLGTFADGAATFGDPVVTESVVNLVRVHWGLGSKILMDLMYPCATPEFVRLFARGQRDAAPVEVAAGYLQAMFEADVGGLLSEIRASSLVIHYTGDRAIPFRGGQQLAAGLPRARMVPLGGSLHLPEGEDADRVTALIRDFVDA